MTFDEFYHDMVTTFPDAVCDQDNEGQLIIYTGLQIVADNQVVPLDIEALDS